jgi:Universal stress protein family
MLVRQVFQVAVGGIPRDVAVTIETPEGDPGTVLTDTAADGDLLVVGAGRPSVRRLVHGSASRYCCVHARCPVVVIPAGPGRDAGAKTALRPDVAVPDRPGSGQPERQGRAMVASRPAGRG